jgi:N-acyl-D-aspartate/D-glutamate deacylase
MMIKARLWSALALVAYVAPAFSAPLYDLLIVNGQVVDGDGRTLDGVAIAIDGDRIVAVEQGLAQRASARRTIDARGMIVAPGFIDPHTHANAAITSPDAAKRANLAWAFQGVSTVVVGNDGDGLGDAKRPGAATGTNYAVLSGFGRIRRSVIGDVDRAPTAAELTQMQQAVARDMCDGAFGFSTGLYYAPQSFAKTDEVIALASVAARMGGYYDTHMRMEGNDGMGVVGALDEALEITEKAGMPLHVSHIKALGPAAWGKAEAMIDRIEKARARGREVTADQYPWDASGTRLSSALLPRSAVDGGMEAMRLRLADPAQVAAIERAIEANIAARGGPERLLVTNVIGNAGVTAGKTLAQLASESGTTPAKVAIEALRKGDANVASFNMSAENIKAFAYKDWVVTGSDGSTGHPRMYATFPKAWNDLVREGSMSIGRFIARSTGDTARVIGFEGRGFLRAGYAADIVIFDPERYKAVANYVNPTALSSGVQTLLVNGVPVIENGRYAGSLPGVRLKKVQKGTQCSAPAGG